MRRHSSAAALAVAVTLIGSNIAWAGSAGRRNTAIAATAIAVGAWSNGTGRAGRRNTALLTTAGAAYAWKRYGDKKKQERRRTRVVYVQGRPRVVRVVERPQVVRVVERPQVVHVVERSAPVYVVHEKPEKVEYVENPGRHLGWYKQKHHKHDDD